MLMKMDIDVDDADDDDDIEVFKLGPQKIVRICCTSGVGRLVRTKSP